MKYSQELAGMPICAHNTMPSGRAGIKVPKRHLEKKPPQGRLLVHLETFLEPSTNEITLTPQEIASKPHQREKCLRLYKQGTQWNQYSEGKRSKRC